MIVVRCIAGIGTIYKIPFGIRISQYTAPEERSLRIAHTAKGKMLAI